MANPVKIPAKVSSITEHGEGVYTVVFKPEKRLPKFKPGQFLHLAIDEYDPCGGFWPDSRVFSIASAPDRDDISIVYSVKGKFTARMCSELAEGSWVWLKLPYGHFNIDTLSGESQDIVLIAGGTGISPYIPYIENVRNIPSGRKIHLIYGVRNPEHILFLGILDKLASSNGSFICDLYIENFPDNGINYTAIKTHPGMILIEKIWLDASNYNLPVFFLSGPPAMIKSFKTILSEKGLGSNRICIDEWE